MAEVILFDSSSPALTTNLESNKLFLFTIEKLIRHKLAGKTYLYSNQIYDTYGIDWDPRTHANKCYLKENGELMFDYEIFSNGLVNVIIWQTGEGI